MEQIGITILTDGTSGKRYLHINLQGATSKYNYIMQRIEGLENVGEKTLSKNQVQLDIKGFTVTVKRNYGDRGTPTPEETIVSQKVNVGADGYRTITFDIPHLVVKH